MALEQEKTRLIILGAGASVDCGFYPTGAQLIELAKKVISFCDDLKDIETKSKEDIEHLQNFITIKAKPYLQNLIDSNHSSIDSHISYIQNEDEQKFLKSFILSSIIACTAYSDLIGNFENNWYAEISKLIFPTFASGTDEDKKIAGIEEKLKSLQIITFNYDVSLEIYLKKAVARYFGNFDKSAQDAFEAICSKIYHVYGQIAKINNVEKVNTSTVRELFIQKIKENINIKTFKHLFDNTPIEMGFAKLFFSEIIKNTILVNAKKLDGLSYDSIKVIGEERLSVKEEIDKIIKVGTGYKEFNEIFILGYGFDSQNNQLIELENLKANHFFATNYKHKDGEISNKIERVIYDSLSKPISHYSDSSITYKIPFVSHKSVSEALKYDFGFLEEKSQLKIKTNLSPYLEMTKR